MARFTPAAAKKIEPVEPEEKQRPLTDEEKGQLAKAKNLIKKDFPDKWCLLRVEQKRHEHEPEDVTVCVNGENVRLLRGFWVPVNWAFKEALDHAEVPVYSTEAGEQRKVVGMYTRFPYQGPFPITKEQYAILSVIARNRKLTAEEVKDAIGFDVR